MVTIVCASSSDDSRRSLFASTLLCASIIAGCGGGAKTTNNPIPPVSPPPAGLDVRPNNVTCVAPARGAGGGAVDIVDAFPGLPGLSQPVKVLVEPVANPRWFILEKGGLLRVFDPDNATVAPTFLDINDFASLRTASEGGLLGMAFHPDYPAVREIFLSYTINGPDPSDGNGPNIETISIISRVVLDNVASPSPIGMGSVEEVILEVDQFASNHNGGDIAFGVAPDRSLYIGLGDGGGGGDPQETGQDTTRLLGSLLRIDVIGTGADYTIPAGNPFAANPNKCGPGFNAANCPEIYAWGLRNPWRWSFDPPTNVLWLGDVGQGSWEEIDQIVLGGNYGWDCREGAHPHAQTQGCIGNVIDPVSEYPHTNGNVSITGGFVYRGTAIPGLVGRYVFADFASGRIWALQSDGQGGYTNEELLNSSTGPSSFGVDQAGELYFTDYNNGRIMQLISTGGGADPVSDLLSDSGCTNAANITQPYSGLVPYDISAPFWSDGATKDRYIGLPNGTTMVINAEDDWDFPAGTVLVKNFRLNGRLIETRHLMRHPDGVWAGYTYEWKAIPMSGTRPRLKRRAFAVARLN
jgi:glucose/arabinose dehydrogenase